MIMQWYVLMLTRNAIWLIWEQYADHYNLAKPCDDIDSVLGDIARKYGKTRQLRTFEGEIQDCVSWKSKYMTCNNRLFPVDCSLDVQGPIA